jgi:glycosyltransferase involved in cell wall biosynthesis
MRVLLYETGESGHRGVYRGYYATALHSASVDVVVHSEPSFTGLFGFNAHLQKLARKSDCELVHILTMDDHTKRLFLSKQVARSERLAPIVATYYLYSNIKHPIIGPLIRKLVADRKVAAIVVPSAMQILSPEVVDKYRSFIHALPEPHETEPEIRVSKSAALAELGLPKLWSDKTIGLIFGVLNKRRGIDQIVRLIASSASELDETRFIFAGPLDSASVDANTIKLLGALTERGLARVFDRWWPSEEASKIFGCADLFCIAPDKRFGGASSTVARAIRCGLMVVAPSDSVAGQCAHAKGRGLLFRRGEVEDFAKCIRAGANTARGKRLPQLAANNEYLLSTGLSEFGQLLIGVYEQAISGHVSPAVAGGTPQ